MKEKKFYIVIVAFLSILVVSLVILLGILAFVFSGVRDRQKSETVGDILEEDDAVQGQMVPDGELAATVSLVGEIIGQKNFYVDTRVAVGPVVVTNNDADKKIFSVKEISSKDVYIEVDYGRLPETEEWEKLRANKESIIYVKGIVKQHNNATSVYIEADTVIVDSQVSLPVIERKEDAPVVEKEKMTNREYPQGNIRYVPYENDRYRFYIEYPDIFNDKILADNGDGITLRNTQLDTTLKVYGYNNINEETVMALYEEDLGKASTLLYKFQKDNWYVISWEDGQDGFYKKVFVGEESIKIFIMRYPKKYDSEYSPLVEHLFNTFN